MLTTLYAIPGASETPAGASNITPTVQANTDLYSVPETAKHITKTVTYK